MEVRPYEQMVPDVSALASAGNTLWLDPSKVSYAVYQAAKEAAEASHKCEWDRGIRGNGAKGGIARHALPSAPVQVEEGKQALSPFPSPPVPSERARHLLPSPCVRLPMEQARHPQPLPSPPHQRPSSFQRAQYTAANGGTRKRARTETDTAADVPAPAEAAPAAAATGAASGAAPKVFVEQASPVVAAKAVKNDAELVSRFEFEIQGCRFGV